MSGFVEGGFVEGGFAEGGFAGPGVFSTTVLSGVDSFSGDALRAARLTAADFLFSEGPFRDTRDFILNEAPRAEPKEMLLRLLPLPFDQSKFQDRGHKRVCSG